MRHLVLILLLALAGCGTYTRCGSHLGYHEFGRSDLNVGPQNCGDE